MGTALTEQQLGRLSRLTRNLYLCFDADAAGIGAMQRALTLGRRMNLSLHVVRIPDGLDPADYVLSGRRRRRAFARLPATRRRCYNSTSAWRLLLTTSTDPMDGHARLRD